MNIVILEGRLGQDAVLSYTQNQKPVCNFSIAVTKTIKDVNGKKKEVVIWPKIVMWGRIAETLSPYLKKGVQVMVQGELQYNSYDHKQYKDVKIPNWMINSREVKLLSRAVTPSEQQSESIRQQHGSGFHN